MYVRFQSLFEIIAFVGSRYTHFYKTIVTFVEYGPHMHGDVVKFIPGDEAVSNRCLNTS